MKFVGIVGSNAEQSYNRELLKFIRRHFKLKFELELLEITDIPMFNQDIDVSDNFNLKLLYNKITGSVAKF
ncbi:Predicted flavoprotein [Enterococcus faecium]|nr:Predicted flavoprotein [Enterococcus faecium]